MQRQKKFYYLFGGLTGAEQSAEVTLDDGTKNFYYEKGYLCNYPGRKDRFNRTIVSEGERDIVSIPPTLGTITRIISFVDFTDAEHIVVCYGKKICVIEGNRFNELYELSGREWNGACYPTFFIHESKLVIINEGDIPLLWDGVKGVNPLGVQEVPSPPFNHTVYNPFAGGVDNLYRNGTVTVHFSMGEYETGPTRRTDGASPVYWEGKTIVQYYDEYGNHGAASAPSIWHRVNGEPDAEAFAVFHMMTEWEPPQNDWHIAGTRQGRTLTFNPDDANPAGTESQFFTETTVATTKHRKCQTWQDEELVTFREVDLEVQGPPNSRIGCSFNKRIWLVDQNGIGWYSDLALFGQFRSSQTINYYSHPVAYLPAGDRLFVVGEKSTEVYYESEAGPALFELDIENGSLHGSSFVVVGDGVIFGLWSKGFGFYDGKEHSYIAAPDYIDQIHIDATRDDIKRATLVGRRYMLPVRYRHESAGAGHILIYDMDTKNWFLIEEGVNDIHEIDGEIYGVDDSVYYLFTEGSYPASTLKTNGFTPNAYNQTAIDGIRLMMQPSSAQQCNIVVYGEYLEESTEGQAALMPVKTATSTRRKYRPHWNETGAEYPKKWSAPGDFLSPSTVGKSVPGMYHKFEANFPAGHPIKLKGFEVTYESDSEAEG